MDKFEMMVCGIVMSVFSVSVYMVYLLGQIYGGIQMITYYVQTTFLGGWVDVYKGSKLLFTKKFNTLEQLNAIKANIDKIKEASNANAA